MKNIFVVHVMLFISQNMFANRNIKATIEADKTTGNLPLTVKFNSAQKGSNVSCRWDFGNGNTSVLKNPTATFVNPGNYKVKLVVSSGTETDSAFISIKVLPNPSMLDDFLKSRATTGK